MHLPLTSGKLTASCSYMTSPTLAVWRPSQSGCPRQTITSLSSVSRCWLAPSQTLSRGKLSLQTKQRHLPLGEYIMQTPIVRCRMLYMAPCYIASGMLSSKYISSIRIRPSTFPWITFNMDRILGSIIQFPYWKPPFKRKQEKKIQGKKCFLSFYSVCMFVCMFFCLCVCLSVVALQTPLFNTGDWNVDIDTYMWISQNSIFYFF